MEGQERDAGGEETGAHFLWKWGYHFTITGAITVGGLQKLGNKAYRHTDGHSDGDMSAHGILLNTRVYKKNKKTSHCFVKYKCPHGLSFTECLNVLEKVVLVS